MRCAVWDIGTGKIVWQEVMDCGELNEDGRYLIVYQPHVNPNSAYWQIAVYEVATGEIRAVSEDEVTEYRWIDPTHVMLQRPYGDAPVIWDVTTNTRAVLETPFRGEIFWVISLPGDLLVYARGATTYIWDRSNGRLLREVPTRGDFLIQEDRILLLQMDYDWYDKEEA